MSWPLLKGYLVWCVIAGVLIGTPALAWAQGEHARRAASELLVLSGDLRRLNEMDVSPLHRQGLEERILGALAGLELLLRLADDERGRRKQSYPADLGALREAFTSGRRDDMAARLAEIMPGYPLVVPGILPAEPGSDRLKRGRELHERLCAGCHDQPDTAVRRPAYDLYAEARRLVPLELVARLLVGVRGDASIGIDNPLSDEEIASLVAIYSAGRD